MLRMYFDESSAKYRGDDDLTVLLDEEDGTSDSRRDPAKRRSFTYWRSVSILLVVGIVSAAIVLALLVMDLLLAAPTTSSSSSLLGLQLDVTQAVPRATLELEWKHGSQWSTVLPDHVECQLPSGRVLATFQPQEMEDTHHDFYRVQVTCPIEHVASHAEALWDWMTTHTNTMVDMEDDVVCQIHVQVVLARIWPIHHSIQLSSKELMQAQQAQSIKSNDSFMFHEEEPPSASNKNIFSLYKWSVQELQLGLGLPHSWKQALCMEQETMQVDVELPGMVVSVEPFQKGPTTMVGATFWSEPMHAHWDCQALQQQSTIDHDEFDVLLLGASCSVEQCPWFQPMMEWWNAANSHEPTTTLDVSIDSQGSFLETFLGMDHQVVLEQHDDLGSREFLPLRRRHLLSQFSADTSPLLDPTHHCLSIWENSGHATMALCYSLDMAHGMTFATNMTVYDYAMVGWKETTWHTSNNNTALELATRAILELGGDAVQAPDVVNLTGSATVDWGTPEAVVLDLFLHNDGTLYPHSVSMAATGSTKDQVFNMTVSEASVTWADDVYLTQATGSLVVDVWNMTLQAEILDDDPDSNCNVDVKVVDNQQRLVVTSFCRMAAEDLWDASAMAAYEYGNWDAQQVSIWIDVNETVSELRMQGATDLSSQNGGAGSNGEPWMDFNDPFSDFSQFVGAGNNGEPWMDVNDPFSDFSQLQKQGVGGVLPGTNPYVGSSNSRMTAVGNCTCTRGIDAEPLLWDAVWNFTTQTYQSFGPITEEESIVWFSMNESVSELIMDTKMRTTSTVDQSTFGDPLFGSISIGTVSNNSTTLGTSTASLGGEAWWESFVSVEATNDGKGNNAMDMNLQETVSAFSYKSSYLTSVEQNIFNGVTMDFESVNILVNNGTLMSDSALKGKYSAQGSDNAFEFSFNETVEELTISAGLSAVLDEPGVLPFVIDLLTLEQNKTVYLDATGKLTIDLNNSFAEFDVKDVGEYELLVDMTTTWDVNEVSISIDMSETLVKSGDDVYVDLDTGTFLDEGGSGSLLVISKPDVKMNMGSNLKYDLGSTGSLYSADLRQMLLQVEDDTVMDVTGQMALNLNEMSLLFELEDENGLNFATRLSGNVKNLEGNHWALSADDVYARLDADEYVDMAGDAVIEMDGSDFGGSMNMTSAPEALMQMDMGMELAWTTETGVFRMVMDRSRMGWNGTMYIVAGTDRAAITPAIEEVASRETVAPANTTVNGTIVEDGVGESNATAPPTSLIDPNIIGSTTAETEPPAVDDTASSGTTTVVPSNVSLVLGFLLWPVIQSMIW